MPHLQPFQTSDLEKLLSKRAGETKLGECIHLFNSSDVDATLASFEGKFVILGLPEDIGVRANGGIGGAQTGWLPFIKSFVNIQETEQLNGASFLVLGTINFDDWLAETKDASVETLRDYTSKVDDVVYPIIQKIITAGKIPVVIGGGHNNAYPLLKALSEAKQHAVNVINLDAHSDFRVAEGRHSGNGFRYAYNNGYLKNYALLGLHEAYNSKNIVAELKHNPDLYPIFFESVFLRNEMTWNEAIANALSFINQNYFGVELDVDCIENVLSSAATPVGIGTHEAMQYLYQCALSKNASYLHLPEGVSERADGLQNNFTGKLLSYVVQAFCKGVMER